MKKFKKNKNSKIIFTSKAETLKFLKKRVKKSKIEDIFNFTVRDWGENKKSLLKNISKVFKSQIIVRSSAKGEDSHEKSEAGSYESILNVNPQSGKAVRQAVTQVIRSYELGGNKNPQNLVLIQKQTADIATSGVVLTRESKHGLPYFIINFEEGSRTDGVTKGKSNNIIKIFRKASISLIPKKWKSLICAVKEIESITSIDYLDIEFGITNKGEIVIFQVRPITSFENYQKNQHDVYVKNVINSYKKNFMKFQYSKNLFGKKTIFSDMTDWNPAEIIGNNPNLLDYTLYDYLIMKDSWYEGRSSIGYQKIGKKNLMVKFGNKPYVDVRASFNSLVPSNFEKNITKKLINFYLYKLEKNPHLHDKVEFEILFTCYDFSLKNRLKELQNHGFTKEEIIKIKEKLLEFTNSIIENYSLILENSKKSLNRLSKNRDKILSNVNQKTDYVEFLKAAEILLYDCRKLGTIPFSTMARISFIASALLKSLVKDGSVDSKIADSIMNSINTPLSRFRRDFDDFCNNRISKKEFLRGYGHLRPGTYDITVRRYDDDNRFLNNIKFIKSKKNKSNVIIDSNINKIFKNHGLKLDHNKFKNFIESSLKEREELKFEFTHNLSEALELITKAGAKLGFSRIEMKDLDIFTILSSYKKFEKNELKSIWQKKINVQKKKKANDERLLLPPILFSKNDFEIIPSYIVKPNFITKKSVTAELVYLDDFNTMPNLEQKIILIENADPGYDWIFTKNPAGLITKYGGIASHMSIRCAEISLPAAIGCGEILFEQLVLSSMLLLDCENNQIVILKQKVDDEYIEERKALKSLGYIK